MRRAVAALVSISLAALASCGISEQDSVERINPAQLEGLGTSPVSEPPPSTMAPESTTTIASPPPPTRPSTTTLPSVVVPLYFVDGDQIIRITRGVNGDASLKAIVEMLAAPPEQPATRSAVSAGLVASLYRRGEGETVDLDGELLNGIDPRDQPLMFAQIVLTLTDGDLPQRYGEFSQVRFTVDGAPLSVMHGDTLSEPGAWVTRNDYDNLLDG